VQGEAGLARTADASQRDQAVVREELTHLRQLGLATDEARDLDG